MPLNVEKFRTHVRTCVLNFPPLNIYFLFSACLARAKPFNQIYGVTHCQDGKKTIGTTSITIDTTLYCTPRQEMPLLTPHSCQAAAAAAKLATAANAALSPSCRLCCQADCHHKRHALAKLSPPPPSWPPPSTPRSCQAAISVAKMSATANAALCSVDALPPPPPPPLFPSSS